MIVEAIDTTVMYRWPGGEVRLEPGNPIELPKERATRLLAKACGKVRAVDPDPIPALNPGDRIVWEGPLFGRLTGELLAVLDDGQLEVFHPLTEKLVRIPRAWVRQAQ